MQNCRTRVLKVLTRCLDDSKFQVHEKVQIENRKSEGEARAGIWGGGAAQMRGEVGLATANTA